MSSWRTEISWSVAVWSERSDCIWDSSWLTRSPSAATSSSAACDAERSTPATSSRSWSRSDFVALSSLTPRTSTIATIPAASASTVAAPSA